MTKASDYDGGVVKVATPAKTRRRHSIEGTSLVGAGVGLNPLVIRFF